MADKKDEKKFDLERLRELLNRGRKSLSAEEKAELHNLVMTAPSPPEPPKGEVVLKQLADAARRRNPVAMRLLLGDLEHHRLIQAPAHETPMPAEDVWINGVKLTVPRGQKVTVPVVVKELLDQAGIN